MIVGSSNSISATTPQSLGGSSYTFSSWSDGGAQTHNITAPANPTTYTATFQQAAGSTVEFLSDLAYTVTANGWGPVEKDESNGEAAAGDGGPITIGGQTFTKGLGVHAVSDVRYAMGGNCSLFTASIGVDDEVAGNGSVVFQVYGDTTLLYQSPTQTGAGSAVPISVDVTGRTTLRLVTTDGGNGISFDHADWANAQLTCSS